MKALRTGVVLTLVFVSSSVFGAEVVRMPIAMGSFYPETAEGLHAALTRFFDAAVVPYPDARLTAIVAPHSAYGFCGEVAAHAFKALRPGQFKKVMILAPSHYASFDGCSLPYVSAFATPLGLVPVDGEAVERLCRSPLVTCKTIHSQASAERVPVHEQEHAIEVLLPFLQERLGLFSIIPVLVGNLNDASGRFSKNTCAAVADALRKVIDSDTLLVLSTDLTHYGNDFSFRPFRENIFENIDALDQQALDFITNKDADGFQAYLEKTRNPICGITAIHVFMRLMPRAARGIVLAHDLSGRKTNNEYRSVSYAAINYYIPNQPMDSGMRGSSEQVTTRAQAPRVLRLKGNAAQERAQREMEYYEVEDSSAVFPPAWSPPPREGNIPAADIQEPSGETESGGFAVPGAGIDEIPEELPQTQPAAPPADASAPPAVPQTKPAADAMTPPPQTQEPVLIRMRGSKDQEGVVQVDVQGLPSAPQKGGRVVYQGAPGRPSVMEDVKP